MDRTRFSRVVWALQGGCLPSRVAFAWDVSEFDVLAVVVALVVVEWRGWGSSRWIREEFAWSFFISGCAVDALCDAGLWREVGI